MGLSALTVVGILPRLPLGEPGLDWPSELPAAVAGVLPAGAVVLAYPYPTAPDVQAMVWAAEAHLSYRLLGGYASVQGREGDGQYWPLLLAPAAVQQFFARATAGAAGHEPPVAPPSNSAFCRYLRTAGVTHVLDWPRGRDPATVAKLLRATLGRPLAVRDGVAIYSAARCAS